MDPRLYLAVTTSDQYTRIEDLYKLQNVTVPSSAEFIRSGTQVACSRALEKCA
ncbi:hypothetical protein MPTK1_5g17170 [Marchantia polymorpha subsp. ruderalis]|uniref:Uncharacterized protein n=2 Tax=Marchantia polymorpha TaxID=3197 RepID=A0AAF6BJ93_MARPO|nr:hypothetical protein MARPO_0196s0007 [Marchantia polymorpha]BBN12077.1 hypothetical protein Mp_5g17170 [Marchantia polymorpha subsp. ruderalis]|eukprot:PTQ27495.1 hypothetical protein MARPO_0196s0007 [Marchantia polymorpha]